MMAGLLLWGALGVGFAATTDVVTWDFEDSDGGWSAYGETGQWEHGAVSSGPLVAHSGSMLWATGLARFYYNDSTDYLSLPAQDLSGLSHPILEFYQWYAIDPSGDAGWLEVHDGAGWVRAEPVYGYPTATGFSGSTNGWTRAWLDLGDLTDLAQVRLVFSSDASVALDGWYVDDVRVVEGDPVPPQITLQSAPGDTQDLDGPYRVLALIEDDGGTPTATLHWSTDELTNYEVPMTEGADGLWTGEIPGQPADTLLNWYVTSSDGENESTDPEDGSYLFRVYLAAPTQLSGPAGRVVSREVTLSWEPPESPHPVLNYRVYRTGTLVAEPTEATATVPLSESYPTFEVAAVYDVGEGDRSSPLVLHVAVPTVTALSPTEAWQGDLLRVAVSGDYLLLTGDDADLDLGEGLSVEALSVTDADHATFTVRVDDEAPIGVREGTLTSGDQQIPLELDFTVHDGADRPALISISPDELFQGDQVELVLCANTTLEGTPEVDLGEDIIIEEVSVNGRDVTISATVPWDADIGTRAVSADDGTRVLEGVDLRVRNALTTPQKGCASAPGQADRLPIALTLLALLRRRYSDAPGRRRPTPTSAQRSRKP